MLCGYVGIWGLAFPTLLEQLLEDSGSLPASKRVSGTHARLRIEVYGCLSLCNTGGWVRYLDSLNGGVPTGKWLARPENRGSHVQSWLNTNVSIV